MSPSALLDDARRAGVEVCAEGEMLVVYATGDDPPEPLLMALKEAKPAILAFLAGNCVYCFRGINWQVPGQAVVLGDGARCHVACMRHAEERKEWPKPCAQHDH